MQYVDIVESGNETTGTAWFLVRDQQEKEFLIDNCHYTFPPNSNLSFKSYHGTTHFDNCNKIVILRIYNDGPAEIEIIE